MAAKPDFLDLDGDGDTSEPMKTAVKQKKAAKMKKGGRVKKMKGGGAVSTERNGVLQEHYKQPQPCPMELENSGFSRGAGAAISGTKFVGVR